MSVAREGQRLARRIAKANPRSQLSPVCPRWFVTTPSRPAATEVNIAEIEEDLKIVQPDSALVEKFEENKKNASSSKLPHSRSVIFSNLARMSRRIANPPSRHW